MMTDEFKSLIDMRLGVLLSLITLLYGFGLGGTFGLCEDQIKDSLKNDAQKVLTTVYAGDSAAVKKVIDKSWVYFKRAHLHANGLGTTSLALILLLAYLPISRLYKFVNATALGGGSLGYALFWMFAGIRAPGLGSTSAAKESLRWLAIPSAGMCILGVTSVFVLAIYHFYVKRPEFAVAESL